MRRVVMHHHAGAERVEENVDLVRGEQIVGRDLVGRGVIGLREDFSENEMRRVQPAEPVDPTKQIGGDALHHPVHLAMDVGVQPAEIRHARRRAHAAEKAIALDQQRTAALRAQMRNSGGDAWRVRRRGQRRHIRRKAAPGAQVLRWSWKASQGSRMTSRHHALGWRILPCVKGLRKWRRYIALIARN